MCGTTFVSLNRCTFPFWDMTLRCCSSLRRQLFIVFVYACSHVHWLITSPLFHHTLPCSMDSFFHLFSVVLFRLLSLNSKDAIVNRAKPSSGVEEISQVVHANGSDTPVTDIDIDREVPSRTITEYKTGYADRLDARQFGAWFSDRGNLFMFVRGNVRQDRDIGAWNWRGTLFRRWCTATSLDVFGIDMLIVRLAQKTGYLRHLPPFLWIVRFPLTYRGIDLAVLRTRLTGFTLWRTLTLGDLSWSLWVSRDIIRVVRGLTGGGVRRCLRYRIAGKTVSTL